MKAISQAGLLVALILLPSLTACGGKSGGVGIAPLPDPIREPTATFIDRGLSGLNVISLAKGLGDTSETVVAGTDRGIYFFEGESNGSRRTPEGWKVFSLEALYAAHLLASIEIEPGTHYLAESLNGGQDWTFVETNFGGTDVPERSEPLRSLEFVANSGEICQSGTGLDCSTRAAGTAKR